jgi:hypothetical protein
MVRASLKSFCGGHGCGTRVARAQLRRQRRRDGSHSRPRSRVPNGVLERSNARGSRSRPAAGSISVNSPALARDCFQWVRAGSTCERGGREFKSLRAPIVQGVYSEDMGDDAYRGHRRHPAPEGLASLAPSLPPIVELRPRERIGSEVYPEQGHADPYVTLIPSYRPGTVRANYRLSRGDCDGY